MDGRAPEEPLLEDRWDKHPNAVHPDGTVVAFQKLRFETAADIWMLPLTPDGTARVPFIETEFTERNAVFSPDGRWLAYESNESGRFEIYVVGYPDAEALRQISTDGGISPLWGPSGRELYYRNGDKMMAVELDTTAGFTVARPRVLFEAEFAFANRLRDYDIAPDGKRFLMIQLPPEAAHSQLEVVVQWFEELRRLVPTE